jgi:hypothetical protein
VKHRSGDGMGQLANFGLEAAHLLLDRGPDIEAFHGNLLHGRRSSTVSSVRLV